MRISCTLFLFFTLSSVLSAQSFRESRTVWASAPAEVPAMARAVDVMLNSGHLVYERYQVDGSFQGRHHERMNQYHSGLRVFGGQLVWQKQSGLVLSVTGNLYDDIGINTTPSLTTSQAEARALELEGPEAFAVGDIELMVLPLADGYVLAYYVLTRSPDALQVSFIDAHSGERVLTWNDIRTQYEGVGLGIGTWGDRKKMTTEQSGRTFRAVDTIRPFGIKTYDVNFDFVAWNFFRTETDAFLATDIDNEWTDGPVVDAHVYSGYTYDYYFKRHNRRGIDDRGLVAINYVHIGFPPGHPYRINAFYFPFDNSMNYGDGDGKSFGPFSSALDVVAHEITHGVTEHSSGLIYRNESGALDEAISDIMGAAVEFSFQPEGNGRLNADWVAGEDLRINFGEYTRSFSNPKSAHRIYPDHYSIRYLGDEDNGGVHINSSIVNHAYYLMVMGGTNRTSGVSVNGVGFAQMERIERIFYRGFMYYLVPSSNFSDAREATIRAARELYGSGSVEEQTVRAGWNAVGVQ